MRVGEALADALAEAGTEVVFGIPGVHTIELYRGAARSGLRAVTPRHEQGAGFMADGYARASGRPGVCLLITGPGVTNALTPIAQAFHDSVPLFVLASTTARRDLHRGRGALHDLPDQAGLLESVAAYSETVVNLTGVRPAFERAWTAMLSGRSRPVALNVPTDLLRAELEPLQIDLPRNPPAEPDHEAVRRAAEVLAGASRPVVLLGGGAIDAGEPAADLAAMLDAPIALTGNAKGSVPASHPLCLGATLPFSPIRALFAEADVALLVGTELSEVDLFPTRGRLRFGGAVVRVDIDPGQLDSGVAADAAVVGDACAVLSALLDSLRELNRKSVENGRERASAALGRIEWPAESKLYTPWLDALERALPDDRILALDSTKPAYTAQNYLQAERPRSWLAPYGYGTLGPALPMAIGAKLACPERPVAALAGDGGLLFTIAELATAVDLRLTLPVVVWDNRGYGEIRDSFDRASAPRVGTETTARDLLAIAAGFGCATAEAAAPEALSEAVSAALEADRPTVIRVAATD